MAARNRSGRARVALGIPLFAILVVGAAACNTLIGANEPTPRGLDASVAPSCVLNSDCTTTGQICIFRVCSPPCHTDTDCTDGSRCLQAPDGTVCVANAVATCDAMLPCPTGSACQAGACRNACGGSQRCLSQQECQAGVCVGMDPTHDPGLGALASDASADQSAGEGSAFGNEASEDGTTDGLPASDASAPSADAPVADSPCGNTGTDPHNCGSCGHDCTALPHLSGPVTCGAIGQCAFAPSSCAPGWAHCAANPDLGCETDISKPSNCGACGTVCPASAPVCSGSGSTYSCVTGCSGSTPSLCGGTCVDTATDPSNCATCMHSCGGVVHGQPKCAASVCTIACNSGYTGCGGACVDTTSDDNNCNGCGKACAGGQHCTGGSCQCPSGTHTCSGTCVANDVAACGPSCTMCATPTGGTVTCNGMSCVQACSVAGNVVCGTACVNESTDVNNCGSCANKCTGTMPYCLNSGCVECMSGTTQCVNSTQQQTCGANGHWGTATTCADACVGTGVGGKCGGMCVPGSLQCNYGTETLQDCDNTGTWVNQMACTGGMPLCRSNACVASSPYDIGNSTQLPNANTESPNYLTVQQVTVNYRTSLLRFGVWGRDANHTPSVVMAIYADNGSGAPGAYVASTSPVAITAGAVEAPVGIPTNLMPGTYWIGGIYSAQADTSWSNTMGPAAYYAMVAYPGTPNPFPAGAMMITGYTYNYYIVVQDY